MQSSHREVNPWITAKELASTAQATGHSSALKAFMMVSRAGHLYFWYRSLCLTQTNSLPEGVKIRTRPYPPRVRSQVASTIAEGNTSLMKRIAASRSCSPPSQLGPNATTNSCNGAELPPGMLDALSWFALRIMALAASVAACDSSSSSCWIRILSFSKKAFAVADASFLAAASYASVLRRTPCSSCSAFVAS